MSIVVKTAVICLSAAIINLILKKTNPEIAPAVTLCALGVIITGLFEYIKKGVLGITELALNSGIGGEYVEVIIKIILIAYFCEYSAALIEDTGETAPAKGVETAGKIVIFVMTIPILKELFTLVLSIAGK